MTVTAYLDKYAALLKAPIARAILEDFRSGPNMASRARSGLGGLPDLQSAERERRKRVDIILHPTKAWQIEGGSQRLPLAIADKFKDRIITIDASHRDCRECAPRRHHNRQRRAPAPSMPRWWRCHFRRCAALGLLASFLRCSVGCVRELGPGNNEKLLASFKGRPGQPRKCFQAKRGRTQWCRWCGTTRAAPAKSRYRRADILPRRRARNRDGQASGFVCGATGDPNAIRRWCRASPPRQRASTSRRHGIAILTLRQQRAHAQLLSGADIYVPELFWNEGKNGEENNRAAFGRLAFAGEHQSSRIRRLHERRRRNRTAGRRSLIKHLDA